jgi:2-dehydropantoate 2-reductase
VESEKFKIAVVGIGGVGGYIGGRLAARFENSADVEISLLARGANERAIKADGLKLVTTEGEQIVKPNLILTTEIGDADLLVLCTKDYDLEETVSALKNSTGAQTAILPLLNGADTAERIAKILPQTQVWQGCIYIVTRLVAPGVVEETGNVRRIFFGSETGDNEKMLRVETIFNDAGIEAHLAEDISAKVWEKFVFISSIAAATAYFDATIREVVETDERKKLLFDLVDEVKAVAKAKKINVSETALRQTFDRIGGLPRAATSSMHSDFRQGNKTEVESLVGYVVREAAKSNAPVPNYERIYAELARGDATKKL